MKFGAHVRRAKAIFGRLRQERKRVVYICESCRSCRLTSISWILLTLLQTEDSRKLGGPTGEPRSSNPSLVVSTPGGNTWSGRVASAGTNRRDLLLFKRRPREGPWDSIIVRAEQMSLGDSHKVPSSRYQALISKPGTSLLICSTTGWQSTRDPRGHPAEPHSC